MTGRFGKIISTFTPRRERERGHEDLRLWSKLAKDRAADPHPGLRDRPVRAPLDPGRPAADLTDMAPKRPEPVAVVSANFGRIVLGGVTDWQPSRYFANVPAHAAPASMLAEQRVHAIACKALIWQPSPAAREVEQKVVVGCAARVGLPAGSSGICSTIHDTATPAKLSAGLQPTGVILCANSAGVEAVGHPALKLPDMKSSSTSTTGLCPLAGGSGR